MVRVTKARVIKFEEPHRVYTLLALLATSSLENEGQFVLEKLSLQKCTYDLFSDNSLYYNTIKEEVKDIDS